MDYKLKIAILLMAISTLGLSTMVYSPFWEARNECLDQGFVDGGLDSVHGKYCTQKVCPAFLGECYLVQKIMGVEE